MDYLSYFLKTYDFNLQPSNSEPIDIEIAKYILYPGAHIAASNPYEHFHHGIVLDPDAEDVSIIHFWGPDKNYGLIHMTTLPIFLAGSKEKVGIRTRQLYLVNYANDTLEQQQATVERAKAMLGKANEIHYNLATSNCESFACYCRTGKWESEQTMKIKNLLLTKASEIYQRTKDADHKNTNDINAILNVLTPSERALYDELCSQTFDS